AYAQAAKRLPANADVYADWAETVGQTQGRSFAGQPTELLHRALAVAPANPKALALGGAAAVERNDPSTAIVLWTRFRSQLPPDSPQIAQVDAALARLGAQPAATAPVPSVPAKAAPPSVPAKAATTSAAGETVAGRVEL